MKEERHEKTTDTVKRRNRCEEKRGEEKRKEKREKRASRDRENNENERERERERERENEREAREIFESEMRFATLLFKHVTAYQLWNTYVFSVCPKTGSIIIIVPVIPGKLALETTWTKQQTHFGNHFDFHGTCVHDCMKRCHDQGSKASFFSLFPPTLH